MIFSITHTALNNTVYICTSIEMMYDKIIDFFKLFAINIHNKNEICISNCIYIEISKFSDYFEVFHCDNKIQTKVFNIAFGHTVHCILDKLCLEYNEFILFHGSAISYNNKSICFIGNTKVGKSTVISKILYELPHCDYMTDDVIGINKQNYSCSFPKPIFIRDIDFLKNIINIDLYAISSFTFENEHRSYYTVTNSILTHSTQKVDKIVVLKRIDTQNFKVNKLFGSKAFLALWKNVFSSENILKKREIAINLAQTIDVYEVYFNDINKDYDNLIKLFI